MQRTRSSVIQPQMILARLVKQQAEAVFSTEFFFFLLFFLGNEPHKAASLDLEMIQR